MKKDVNFTLLALIVSTIIVLVGFTVYYQTIFSDLSNDYDEKVARLEKVTEELGLHKTELNRTTIEITKEKESFDDLSIRYNEIRDENEKLTDEKNTLEKELVDKRADLVRAQTDLTRKATQLSQCQDKLGEANENNLILRVQKDQLEEDYYLCQTQLENYQ